MPGRAAVAMWWDIAPEMRPEWEDWHTHEHMPERLGIPGFLRGSRWIAASGEPSYFVLYETARLSTIMSGPYLERLNDPSPWSRKMMPHHRNMVRSLCRVRASFGGGLGQALATIRFSPPPRGGRALLKRLSSEVLPGLPGRRGLSGAHLLESQPAASTPQTTEQRIRGSDARADRALLVCGYDVDAVRAVARDELALPDAVEGLYRLAYSMTSKDLPG
ncbi:MAG TPA: hypothetical protein VJM14_07770 [Burkholderiales bacterium]|nr:hypothetical protein [Burkholderiales bacterium]